MIIFGIFLYLAFILLIVIFMAGRHYLIYFVNVDTKELSYKITFDIFTKNTVKRLNKKYADKCLTVSSIYSFESRDSLLAFLIDKSNIDYKIFYLAPLNCYGAK